MGVKASKLLNRSITIDTPEGPITIHYRRPTVRDLDTIRARRKGLGEGDDEPLAEVFAAQVVPQIVAWDILGDDDKPLPITEENVLAFVPAEEMTLLLRSIQSAIKETRDPEASTGPSSTSS